jgi:hypothetical protein
MLAMGQFVQNANFGERKLALQQAFVQDADVAGVEAIEASNSLDQGVSGLEQGGGHGAAAAGIRIWPQAAYC